MHSTIVENREKFFTIDCITVLDIHLKKQDIYAAQVALIRLINVK